MQQLLQVPKQETELKASQILRQTTVTQIEGVYSNPINNAFCAFGALLNAVGWDGFPNIAGTHCSDKLNQLGINGWIRTQIINHNDTDHWSFNQIADWLEERGL